MYKHPLQKKVPGEISFDRKKEKQGYIEDISRLSKSQLLDLRNRQEMLLRNKKRISMLPDKGLKITNFYHQILKQLEIHENVDTAAELFSVLNISTVGKRTTTQMEWIGKKGSQISSNLVDSDDEIDYPLKILSGSDIPENYTTEKYETTHQELNSKADLLEMDLKNSSSKLNSLLSKSEQKVINGNPTDMRKLENSAQLKIREIHKTSTKFLPFRTTKSDVHDPEKEKVRYKEHEHKWENTSATPPSLKHSPAKVLSLEESVRLQEEKNSSLQQAQERYAEQRLHQRNEIKEKVMLTTYSDLMHSSAEFQTYRSASESEEDSHESDDDIIDSESHDS